MHARISSLRYLRSRSPAGWPVRPPAGRPARPPAGQTGQLDLSVRPSPVQRLTHRTSSRPSSCKRMQGTPSRPLVCGRPFPSPIVTAYPHARPSFPPVRSLALAGLYKSCTSSAVTSAHPSPSGATVTLPPAGHPPARTSLSRSSALQVRQHRPHQLAHSPPHSTANLFSTDWHIRPSPFRPASLTSEFVDFSLLHHTVVLQNFNEVICGF